MSLFAFLCAFLGMMLRAGSCSRRVLRASPCLSLKYILYAGAGSLFGLKCILSCLCSCGGFAPIVEVYLSYFLSYLCLFLCAGFACSLG